MLRKTLRLEERKMIEKYAKDLSLTQEDIAHLIDRSQSTIAAEFKKTNGREHYTAELGQKIPYTFVTTLKKTSLEELKIRIEALEMQIELFYDLIKQQKE